MRINKITEHTPQSWKNDEQDRHLFRIKVLPMVLKVFHGPGQQFSRKRMQHPPNSPQDYSLWRLLYYGTRSGEFGKSLEWRPPLEKSPGSGVGPGEDFGMNSILIMPSLAQSLKNNFN